MSLRYKSLIVVVLLFAALTGALVYSSSERFETRARVRIHGELDREVKILESRIETRSEVIRSALKASAVGSELVEILVNENFGDIKDNMSTFSREWLTDSKADVSIAVLDNFIVEDRKANKLLAAGENASIVAIEGREGLTKKYIDTILNDKTLVSYISEYFDAYVNGDDGYTIQPIREAVLPVAGRVYLVVQGYLWDSVQDQSAAGVGIVLKELSSDWLQQFYAVDSNNPAQTIVFNGDTAVAATCTEDLSSTGSNSAKSAEFEFQFDDQTFIGRKFYSSLTPNADSNNVGFLTLKNLDIELQGFHQARRGVLFVASILALIGAILAYFGAYRVIRVLRVIQEATFKVREGKFDTRVEIDRGDELGDLAKAFNDMTGGLKALGLYTHDTLARNILDNPQLLGNASSREIGTIFFNDIKGFTGITESMSAEELTAQLNEYFAALGVCLRDEKGYVDKFIGDSIMAFWGKPFVKNDDYAIRAVGASLACVKALSSLQSKWKNENRPLFHQRIGLATGEVIVGNIGTETKKNFTVIGDAVNLASRIEGINKLYGTILLIDETTAALVKDKFLLREIDRVLVVGKTEPVALFEPLNTLEAASVENLELAESYANALKLYCEQKPELAFEAVSQILERFPQDGPATWLKQRCQSISGEYEPITVATEK